MKKLLVFIVVLALAFSAFAGSTSAATTDSSVTTPKIAPMLSSWPGWGG